MHVCDHRLQDFGTKLVNNKCGLNDSSMTNWNNMSIAIQAGIIGQYPKLE